jgi:hypothetical protein
MSNRESREVHRPIENPSPLLPPRHTARRASSEEGTAASAADIRRPAFSLVSGRECLGSNGWVGRFYIVQEVELIAHKGHKPTMVTSTLPSRILGTLQHRHQGTDFSVTQLDWYPMEKLCLVFFFFGRQGFTLFLPNYLAWTFCGLVPWYLLP